MRFPFSRKAEQRSTLTDLSLTDLADIFKYAGNTYGVIQTSYGNNATEEIGSDYPGLAQGAFRANGVVFACMQARANLFSEARFQFRQKASANNTNRPGTYFGTPDLQPLEIPWLGASTGDLLARAIQDIDLSGNFYAVRKGDYLYRLRPDWVTIVVDGGLASDAEIVGYRYNPQQGEQIEKFLPEQVIHWKPIPDPFFRFRGLSPLVPVALDIMGDKALVDFKLKFFDNSATPNMVIDAGTHNPESFKQWVENFRAGNEGGDNAHSSLILANGASAQIVGSDLKSIDVASVQGVSERRIAAAFGVPSLIVGLASDVDATYANYQNSRRRFSDLTMRPLWRSFCAAASNVINLPPGAELVVDDRNISFVQEDVQDAATIRNTNSTAIRTLVDAGFEPDSVVKAIEGDDLNLLKHSGLSTVQVGPQPLPTNGSKPSPSPPVISNGS